MNEKAGEPDSENKTKQTGRNNDKINNKCRAARTIAGLVP